MGVSKFGGRQLFLISGTLPGSASSSDALSVPSGSSAGPSTASAPCAWPASHVPPVARTSPPVVFRKSPRDFISSSLAVASIPHHRFLLRFLLVDWMRVRDDYGLPSSLSQAT